MEQISNLYSFGFKQIFRFERFRMWTVSNLNIYEFKQIPNVQKKSKIHSLIGPAHFRTPSGVRP
jgi:hypothetical protein